MTADTHRLVAAYYTKRRASYRYILLGTGLRWDHAQDRWTRLDDARRAGLAPGVAYYAVRADSDPDPRWADAEPEHGLTTDRLWTGPRATENAGRAIGKALGYRGNAGGWIYGTSDRPITQGWSSLAHIYGATYDAEVNGWRLSANGIRKIDGILEQRRQRADRATAQAAAPAGR